ncbi:rhomboid family intramembrane serine protease [uncultured Propionibacterium sp.]|uniref:rhomboid family intramembrane serine protease n=1 Tax=uncultured Propionibacterium sp. TaxID=218066 RepID=UPI00292CF6F9|nr:rhomboid family intramembrane serine protease [uncultured Propionibacterium sp.]
MSDETNTGGTEPTPPPGTPDFAAPDSPWPSLDPQDSGKTASGPAPDQSWQAPPATPQRPDQPAPGPSTPEAFDAMPAWGHQPARMPGAPQYGQTASGGYVPAGWGASGDGRPLVTYTMMGICAALWLLSTVAPQLSGVLELVPDLAFGQPWRLLTGGFLYLGGSFISIGLGVLTIWIVGQAIEPRMGHKNFLMLYLLSLIGGSAALVLWCRAFDTYQLANGASAAVWGMFGVLATIRPQGSGQTNSGLWVLIGLNVAYVFLFPTIAWQAKLGGFLVGLAAGWLVKNRSRTGQDHTYALWLLLIPIAVALGIAALL